MLKNWNWNLYKNILSAKVNESLEILQESEKKTRQAKAQYEAAVREQESFESSMSDYQSKMEGEII